MSGRWFGRIVVLIVAVALSGFGAGPGFARPADDKAGAFVFKGINAAIDILRAKAPSRAQKLQGLRQVLVTYFDNDAIGRFALGSYRRQGTDDQIKRYLTVLEDYVLQTYGNRLLIHAHKIRDDLKAADLIRVVGTTPVGNDDLVVNTEINRTGGEIFRIDWQVREKGDRLVVVDVRIAGVSQALTYRQEFAAVIEQRGRGIDGLIDALTEKLATLKADN